ncbi:MAG: hypothetical protein SFV19_12570 [Rhodospirillaceae bacterium]|nr:hypothetical protein [Rhodospirillaceae bacterium]
MPDYHQQDFVEQIFATTMPYANFQKLVLRTCKSPHWVIIEGRDRSIVPHVTFVTVRFSSIEDRDRVIISLRFAESEMAPAPVPPRKPVSAESRLAVA